MPMSYAAAVVAKIPFFGSSSSHDDSSGSQHHESNIDRIPPDERLGALSLQDSRKTEPISRGGRQEPEIVVTDLKANIGKQDREHLSAKQAQKEDDTKKLLKEMADEIRRLQGDVSRRDGMLKEFEKQRTRDLETFKNEETGLKGGLVKRDAMLRQANEREESLRASLKARYMEVYELRKSQEILSKTQANELMTLRKESDHHRRLLDIRALELKGAQTFLGKTDSISGQDVIMLMDALNSEILQTAALMAETFDLDGRTQGVSVEATEAGHRIVTILGAQIVQLLLERGVEDDAMLLQIAFQGILVDFSLRIIDSWSLVYPQTDQFLQSVYAIMQDTGKCGLQ